MKRVGTVDKCCDCGKLKVYFHQTNIFLFYDYASNVINVLNYFIGRNFCKINYVKLLQLPAIIFVKYFIHSAQKVKFSIKDFFSKCEQIRRKLRIC